MNNRLQQTVAWVALWCSCLPMAPPASAQNTETPLSIVVVDGQGAINNIRQHAGHDMVVRVDYNQQPVPGASVAFTLPSQGPSGSFVNGEKTLVVTTDAQGQAIARGLKPNNVAGKFEIRVTASYQGRTSSVTITQFNMAVQNAKSGGHGKLVLVLVALGAAGAVGAVVATRGGSSSPTPTQPAPPPVISISPGTGTVGPPQ